MTHIGNAFVDSFFSYIDGTPSEGVLADVPMVVEFYDVLTNFYGYHQSES